MGLIDDMRSSQLAQDKRNGQMSEESRMIIPDDLSQSIADRMFSYYSKLLKDRVARREFSCDKGLFGFSKNYRYEYQISYKVGVNYPLGSKDANGIFENDNDYFRLYDETHWIQCRNLDSLHRIFNLIKKRFASENIDVDYELDRDTTNREKEKYKLVLTMSLPCDEDGMI